MDTIEQKLLEDIKKAEARLAQLKEKQKRVQQKEKARIQKETNQRHQQTGKLFEELLLTVAGDEVFPPTFEQNKRWLCDLMGVDKDDSLDTAEEVPGEGVEVYLMLEYK